MNCFPLAAPTITEMITKESYNRQNAANLKPDNVDINRHPVHVGYVIFTILPLPFEYNIHSVEFEKGTKTFEKDYCILWPIREVSVNIKI